MKRFKHSLSHYRLLTCDMGKLIPIGLVETLPGDTFQHSTSLLLRMSPQLAPVMHPVSVRVHHWFVPHRLSWPVANGTFEDFITGGSDGLGAGSVFPLNTSALTVGAGDVYDYYGVPVGVAIPANTVSLLPLYGARLIYNEFYRDEDLATAWTSGFTVPRIGWEKDYFTSARPWTQKGPAVSIPISGQATVKTSSSTLVTGTQTGMKITGADGSALTTPRVLGHNSSGFVDTRDIAAGNEAATGWYPNNLMADMTTATSPDVIAFRRAFALQRYQEARAQYGSRYSEYLRYLGVRSSDARLQRPEYLGGGKQTVAFSEVLRTGNVTADATPNVIGQLKGHGIAAMRSNRYRYFCEEHGYIHTFLSIRPRSMYTNGLLRTFTKKTKEDFWQKELELIGQQQIDNMEVFAGTVDATNRAAFGYQDRYAEYRHQPSQIAGEFRTTLDYWHLARKFASLPTLNQSFIECDPTKRIFAEQTANSCWIMASHSIQARRMVGNKTIGRII